MGARVGGGMGGNMMGSQVGGETEPIQCTQGCQPTCNEFTGCNDKESCQKKYPNIVMNFFKKDGKDMTENGFEDCNPGCANAYKRVCDRAPYTPSLEKRYRLKNHLILFTQMMLYLMKI